MSRLHVRQIATKIIELFGNKVDISDIQDPQSEEGKSRCLTRYLAAYAVMNYAQTSEIDAANSIVDGYNDNGIDAFYYAPNNKKIVIVQSKWIHKGSGQPNNGDVKKFTDGIRDLIDLQFERFNQKVQNKQNIIESAINSFDSKFDVILIHTGDEALSIHNDRTIQDLVDELNDAGDGTKENIMTFHYLSQAKIHASLAKGVEGDPINIDVGLTQWGKVEDPYYAVFGVVSGEEVHSWYKQFGNRLFSKNIRKMLGFTDVNEEIKETIQHTPEMFWFYNNGITLIADSVKKSIANGNNRDIGTFQLLNTNIVNGAQTVSTIGQIDDEERVNLESVRIPIKIISLEKAPDNVGINITKANNRQNRIENRDFVSLDEHQIRLKTELALDNIEYNISRVETFRSAENAFDLSEATIALACASKQISLAVQAKREIGKFYENVSKQPYSTIFNENTTGRYVYTAVKCLRQIEQLIQEKVTSLPKRSGKAYGTLIHGNRMLAFLVLNQVDIHQFSQQSEINLDPLNIPEKFNATYEKLLNIIEHNYPDKVLGTLFKNATICKNINTIFDSQ